MERFSPYFTEDSFPVSDVEPWEAYSFVYPEELVTCGRSPTSSRTRWGTRCPTESLDGVHEAMGEWQERWERAEERPMLVYQRRPTGSRSSTSATRETESVHAFHGVEAAVYEALRRHRPPPARVALLGKAASTTARTSRGASAVLASWA